MSRRTFDDVGDTWTVGYDRPLHAFYAQVEPRADLAHDPARRAAFTRRHATLNLFDPDDLLLTVAGDSHRELTTVDELADALAGRGVTLPTTLHSLLARDQTLEDPAPARTSLSRSDVEQAARRAAGARPRTATAATSSPPNRRR